MKYSQLSFLFAVLTILTSYFFCGETNTILILFSLFWIFAGLLNFWMEWRSDKIEREFNYQNYRLDTRTRELIFSYLEKIEKNTRKKK
jgi:hypothetical protein